MPEVKPVSALMVIGLLCWVNIAYAGNAGQLPSTPQPVVELTHWWVSPGEVAALDVLGQAIIKQGGKFEGTAMEDFDAHRARIIEQVSMGYLPAITHWLGGKELQELEQQGILRPLTESVDETELKSHLFPEVQEEIMVNGHLAALPVGIHLWNTAYYNAKIYHELNLLPPQNWDEFLAQAEKIQAAGYIPLAVGNDPWQLGFILDNILLQNGGRAGFDAIFDDSVDIHEWRELLLRTFSQFAALRPFTDKRYDDNPWTANTQLLAEGKVAAQFIGDFALGELAVAGKVADKDFLCTSAPGTESNLYYGIDVFALLKVKEPELIAGQNLIVNTVLDPEVQADYIRHKGGLPVRNDVKTDQLDVCSARSYKRWLDQSLIRIPFIAGRSRLRMSAFQMAASQAWGVSASEVPAVVDKLIKTLADTTRK